jgi:hypothetical protein
VQSLQSLHTTAHVRAHVHASRDKRTQSTARFISAVVGAENQYNCAVLEVEGDTGHGVEVKRKLDAALTVGGIDIRYDGPDTFAANGR